MRLVSLRLIFRNKDTVMPTAVEEDHGLDQVDEFGLFACVPVPERERAPAVLQEG